MVPKVPTSYFLPHSGLLIFSFSPIFDGKVFLGLIFMSVSACPFPFKLQCLGSDRGWTVPSIKLPRQPTNSSLLSPRKTSPRRTPCPTHWSGFPPKSAIYQDGCVSQSWAEYFLLFDICINFLWAQ